MSSNADWMTLHTLEIPDISDKLRRWPCALTGFSHVLRCSSMASGGFPPVFFFNILVGLGWVLGGFSGSAPAGVFLVDTRLPMVQSTCILLLHRGVGQWLSGYTDKNYSIISARSSRHWDNGFEQSVTPTKVPDLCLNAECIRKYTLHRYNIWKIRSQIYGFIYIYIYT